MTSHRYLAGKRDFKWTFQIIMGILCPEQKTDDLWDPCCVYLRDGDKSVRRETKRNRNGEEGEKNKCGEKRQEAGEEDEERRKSCRKRGLEKEQEGEDRKESTRQKRNS